MSLGNVATRLQQFAHGLTGPTRDQLVEERDRLLAAPPPQPTGPYGSPAALPTCACASCTSAAGEAQATRVTFSAWEGRVRTLEAQLARLTWGDEKERDAPGTALAALCDELLRAFDAHRARPWERRVTVDGRGRETATETLTASAEVGAELLGLYRRARESMPFLGAAELGQAISEARRRKTAAMAMPLERPIAVDVAHRAGTTTPPDLNAADGLVPDPANPSVVGGTIRFSRRSRG
jgi:hypothetical protein